MLGLGTAVPEPARAAVPAARERTTAMVTADALPTTQINGVVWTQVMIGTMVYAGGEFTSARPAGAAPGTDETPRKNLLAYDITTGVLSTSFVPGAFNGAVKALAVSSDKKTLYVGGDFTKVDAAARGHFAALDASTGALRSPAPSFNNSVNALAVNSTTVFAGGSFTKVSGKSRSRLAAVSASSGALSGWTATADSTVKALLLTSGSKLLVVGGSFTKLNSTTASGSGAVSPTTGKTQTWKVNAVVKNGTKKSAILSLATDGSTVYGTGFAYGSGNFEGVFAASATDGTVRWLQDCHGDTYGVAPIGDVVYSVGHAHYCGNIGGFPETKPQTLYRGLAVTKAAAGTVAKNGQTTAKSYANFEGKPAPALLNWFPQLSAGSYTGMSQGAWSVVGNGTYLALGGEFPKVNGTSQQGLVRMAVGAVAPNTIGPVGDDAAIGLAAAEQPDGTVAVTWNQLWDRDDLKLNYVLTRNGTTIDNRTVGVPFWRRSAMSFTDAGAASEASSTLDYQLTVSDPQGNAVSSSIVQVARVTEPSTKLPVTGTNGSQRATNRTATNRTATNRTATQRTAPNPRGAKRPAGAGDISGTSRSATPEPIAQPAADPADADPASAGAKAEPTDG
ncbi:MAG: hypothetical protein QM582_13910 [Micropruina sp.]|uniref:hypothetical protein n=1 Tax=Micropruina sp. TaxID=2737536 RepID=UPI0039E2457F